MSELTTTSNTDAKHHVYRPAIDIVEHDASLILYADMPGVSAETIDLTLENNQLTIHGKADARQKTYQRAFTLSKNIDRDNIEAAVTNGVLTLTLPKVAEVAPTVRQIAVKSS